MKQRLARFLVPKGRAAWAVLTAAFLEPGLGITAPFGSSPQNATDGMRAPILAAASLNNKGQSAPSLRFS